MTAWRQSEERRITGYQVRFEMRYPHIVSHTLRLPAALFGNRRAGNGRARCCSEFLGMSPTRYICAEIEYGAFGVTARRSGNGKLAEIARDHQFVELGRFARGLSHCLWGNAVVHAAALADQNGLIKTFLLEVA